MRCPFEGLSQSGEQIYFTYLFFVMQIGRSNIFKLLCIIFRKLCIVLGFNAVTTVSSVNLTTWRISQSLGNSFLICILPQTLYVIMADQFEEQMSFYFTLYLTLIIRRSSNKATFRCIFKLSLYDLNIYRGEIMLDQHI